MPTTVEASSPEQIEIDAVRMSTADIAAYLQEHLGQKFTAYLSGLNHAKTVGQWAAGKVTPRRIAGLRLRHAYQAVRLLVRAFGDETAIAWLFGINSQLGDEAAAFVLRHASLPEEMTPVVLAARSFAEGGRRYELSPTPNSAEEAVREEAVRLARLLIREIEDYNIRPATDEHGRPSPRISSAVTKMRGHGSTPTLLRALELGSGRDFGPPRRRGGGSENRSRT